MAYNLSEKEYRSLKTNLSKAIKTKNARAIITECDKALEIFENKGYPDNWFNWERAKYDAEMSLNYDL